MAQKLSNCQACRSPWAIELDLLASSSLALLFLYLAFAAILGQPVLAPFSSSSPTPLPANGTSSSDSVDESGQFNASFFSLFLLWALALLAGRIFHYIKLPPLLGMLLLGMAFANIPALYRVLVLRTSWNAILRSTAFVLILLRCGLGLNPEVLRKSMLFCSSLGILSTCAEIVAIFLLSHFLFNVPLPLAILFGFVLASTSPAVTVPTMIQLQQEHRGTQKGIPTMTLAGASIDNIFCISGFSIAFAFASAPTHLAATLFSVLLQLLAALLLGLLFGFLLRHVPNPAGPSIHFPRVLLLCSLSLALYFGTKAVQLDVCGPIAVIIACFLAAFGWKVDNPEGSHKEAEVLRQLWNLLFLPLLFVLIGLFFDFSIFNWNMLARALLLIALGLAIRVFAAFAIARVSGHLALKEALFFSIVFLPKATVQAALAPQLFAFSLLAKDQASGQFALQTCILSIILTAPAGQLLIQFLGHRFLSKDDKQPPAPFPAIQIGRGLGESRRKSTIPPRLVDVVVGLPRMEQEVAMEEEEEEEAMEADIFADGQTPKLESHNPPATVVERHSSV